uniref:Uncharacterized protein n=1 Tax=Nelumbo nucifera TaxID=4432 RepID=A0A822Y443_NELNU|nr:TPA_asm: hypothetical protein HUJ06_025862 [Nelumbo nucifera]
MSESASLCLGWIDLLAEYRPTLSAFFDYSCSSTRREEFQFTSSILVRRWSQINYSCNGGFETTSGYTGFVGLQCWEMIQMMDLEVGRGRVRRWKRS